MYLDTLDHFAGVAEKKAAVIRNHPLPFFVSAMMAGAYVGLGIILIFSVGATLDPAWRRLVMGASFGIALTLVIFAGSELFTGHTTFMTLGRLRRRRKPPRANSRLPKDREAARVPVRTFRFARRAAARLARSCRRPVS